MVGERLASSRVERSQDETTQALFAFAPDGRVLTWSTGAEATFGYSSDDAIGKHIFEIVLADDSNSQARAAITAANDLGASVIRTVALTGMDFYRELGAVAPEQPSRVIFSTGGAFTPSARAFLEAVEIPCCPSRSTSRRCGRSWRRRAGELPTSFDLESATLADMRRMPAWKDHPRVKA